MIELFDNFNSLGSIEDEWNFLAEKTGLPSLTYEWSAAAARHLLDNDEQLQLLVLRENGALSAAAPLILAHDGVRRRLFLAGSRKLGEPNGLVHRSPDALEKLARRMLSLGYPLELTRLPFGGAEHNKLAELGKRRGFVVAQEEDASQGVSCIGDWAAFESGITGSRRERLRRARKNAAAFGSVELEAVAANARNFDELFGQFMAIEAASWKAAAGTALSADERCRGFFSDFGKSTVERGGKVYFMFLRLGGEKAAVQLAVPFAGKLFILKIGYDEAYSSCSPGILLMHLVIGHAFTLGLQGVEFLGGSEPWLNIWPSEPRRYCTLRAYGLNFSSIVDLIVRGGTKVLRASKRDAEKEEAAAH